MTMNPINARKLPLVGGLLLLAGTTSFAGMIAYIDPAGATTPPAGKFVTNTSGTETTGDLLDYNTGSDFGDIDVSGTYSISPVTNEEWGSGGMAGSLAYDHFEGFIDNADGAGFQDGLITFTFSGLDSDSTYILTVTGIRNKNITDSQSSRFALQGADSFTNTSSTTATYNTVISEDGSYTELSSGTVDVAQWSDIVVGSEGTIALEWDGTVTSEGIQNVGNHYISAISLEAVPASDTH